MEWAKGDQNLINENDTVRFRVINKGREFKITLQSSEEGKQWDLTKQFYKQRIYDSGMEIL